MLSVFKKQPLILAEARKAKFRPSFVIQILIFVAVFLVTAIAQSIPTMVYSIFASARAVMNQEISLNDPEAMMQFLISLQDNLVLLSLLTTGITTVLIIIYCRFIERRSFYSMGFNRKNAVKDYGIGLIVGFVMFGVCVLLSWMSGSMQYNGFILGNGIGLLLGFFIGFVIQGMSEEVVLRGYFMMSVAGRNTILLAVVANSIIFALMHLMNNGITLLAVINLVLFGLFASVYTFKMNSIWGVCAIHSIWNFAQGNIFGIKVSGIDTQVSLYSFVPQGSSTLVNGGVFGLEGGVAVTFVLAVSLLIALKLPGRDIVDSSGIDGEQMVPPLSTIA